MISYCFCLPQLSTRVWAQGSVPESSRIDTLGPAFADQPSDIPGGMPEKEKRHAPLHPSPAAAALSSGRPGPSSQRRDFRSRWRKRAAPGGSAATGQDSQTPAGAEFGASVFRSPGVRVDASRRCVAPCRGSGEAGEARGSRRGRAGTPG